MSLLKPSPTPVYILQNHNKTDVTYQVSGIGFITLHGFSEDHIPPCTGTELPLEKFQKYIAIRSQDKLVELIWRKNTSIIDKTKHVT